MKPAYPHTFRFRRYAWQQLRRHKPAMVSLFVIGFMLIIALLAPYLATEKPWYVNYKGHHLFPAFTGKKNYVFTDPVTHQPETLAIALTDWRQLEKGKCIWAPVPYSPGRSDLVNAGFKGPGDAQMMRSKDGTPVAVSSRFRHWLGTGNKGEDLFSGMIHGTRISLSIGILSMLIASIIGIALGAAAGYYGDSGLQIRRGTAWLLLPGILFGWFYGFTLRTYAITDALKISFVSALAQIILSLVIFTAVIALFCLLALPLNRMRFFAKRIPVPVDSLVSRLIEILISLPKIILIITLAAIARRSMMNIILIIAFTSWTGIARLVRAELLRIRHLDYVQAARAAGLRSLRILWRHALPNALAPAIVTIAFGVASAILAESSLSFLNIGPEHTVTWGSLLGEGRNHFKAWWMILFPGLAIFITVTCYNLLGEGLRDALDPRMKN